MLIKHKRITTLIKESSNEIRYKNIADPKKPIELTLFLTKRTGLPLLISPSAK